MREEAAQTLWADDYELLRERARAHLGGEASPRAAGASRNVRVISSHAAADDHNATAPRRFARTESADEDSRPLGATETMGEQGRFTRAEAAMAEPRSLGAIEAGREPRRFARAEPVREPSPRSALQEPVRRVAAADSSAPHRVPAPRSYGSRRGRAQVRVEPVPRRTVTITGQASTGRRRSPALARVAAEPDRTALWAVMLGIFLVLVALASAHV